MESQSQGHQAAVIAMGTELRAGTKDKDVCWFPLVSVAQSGNNTHFLLRHSLHTVRNDSAIVPHPHSHGVGANPLHEMVTRTREDS